MKQTKEKMKSAQKIKFMKSNSFIILLSLIVSACASSNLKNDCKKCDIDMVAKITDSDKITQENLRELFCTGDKDCSSNAEFMEVFNEALFNSLDKNPQDFIRQFSLSDKKQFFLDQLESPVNDGIELKKIIDKVAQSSVKQNDAQNQILRALNAALKKSNS